MNTKELRIGAAVAALFLFIFLAWQYGEHRAEKAATEAEIKMLKQENDKLAAANASIKAEGAAKVADIQKDRDSLAKQPQQAPQVLREYVPQPIIMQQPATTHEDPKTHSQVPDAPVAVLSQDNQVALADKLLSCKQTEVNLGTCTALRANDAEIIQNDKKELKDAKGGGFWRKAWSTIKIAVPSIAIGYGLSKVKRR